MNQWRGLTESEVRERRERYGANIIGQTNSLSPWGLLVAQFASPVMWVLIVAGIISWALHGVGDAIVVWGAVLLNGLLGFYQEFRAEKSLQALEKMVEVTVEVERGGERTRIPIEQVVVGDICYLRPGEKVPGDGILLEATSLSINEAILTGESNPVTKKANIQNNNEEEIPEESRAFLGTVVSTGLGVMRIVTVGPSTKMGQIAVSLGNTVRTPTKLQVSMAKFAKSLTIVVVVIAALLWLFGMARGMETREIFLVAVAVAVSAIPEGMAVTLTVILALGMQKILRRKGLVRKLLVAESLGSVNMVCADKTGTLTLGELTVAGVEGDKRRIAEGGVLSNDRSDAIEVTIAEWGESECRREQKCRIDGWSRVETIPFDPDKKYGVTGNSRGRETRWVMRGAPEVVLDESHLTQRQRQTWLSRCKELASEGYRLVGMAEKRRVESKWEFLGVVLLEDPVREDVRVQIKQLDKLGVDFCVITGDFAETAIYVMRQLEVEVKEAWIAGEDFRRLSHGEQEKVVKKTKLFARFSPADKLRVVEILKKQGKVVAMMGDGVNDAPALKMADVGIVVSSAAEVSKETADMILLDDRFETVIAGIEEGRGILERIKRVVRYLLSDSFSEVVLVSCAMLVGLPLPVTAAQILWINLANDSLPAMALAFDPIEVDTKAQKAPDQHNLLDREAKWLIAIISSISGLLVVALFAWSLTIGHTIGYAQTLAFGFLGTNTLVTIFVIRNMRRPLWQTSWIDNGYLWLGVLGGLAMLVAAIYWWPLQRLLGTVALWWSGWVMIGLGSMIVILAIETIKWVDNRLVKQPNT